MRVTRRNLVIVGLALAVAGCSSDPIAPRIEDTQFAPELGINLSSMTRTVTGLYVQTLEDGDGAIANVGTTASVYYTGWLADGYQFDSNVGAASPIFVVIGGGGVIRGFEEGVHGMRVGERRRIIIPPHLGYGARRQGPIPPNAILIFDLELVAVQ